MQPVKLARPSPLKSAVRCAGSLGGWVKCTTPAFRRGPYCTGAFTPSGNSPRCHWPQPPIRYLRTPQPPVFRDFILRGRQIEDLAGFNHCRLREQQTARIADRRRCVGNAGVGMLGLLKGMSCMPFLATRRVLARCSQRFRLGLSIPLRRGWLTGVAAGLRQTPAPVGNLSLQLYHRVHSQSVTRGSDLG
jgi:hypothetical protein